MLTVRTLFMLMSLLVVFGPASVAYCQTESGADVFFVQAELPLCNKDAYADADNAGGGCGDSVLRSADFNFQITFLSESSSREHTKKASPSPRQIPVKHFLSAGAAFSGQFLFHSPLSRGHGLPGARPDDPRAP